MLSAHLVFIVAGLAGAMGSTGMVPRDAAILAMIHAHLSVFVRMRSTMRGTVVRALSRRSEAG